MRIIEKSKVQLTKEICSLEKQITKLKNLKHTQFLKDKELYRIGWLLSKNSKFTAKSRQKIYSQPYGDLSKHNTCRVLLDSVGKDILTDIVNDYLNFLETSSAVYEENGDYALGLFSSGWCRLLDKASRNLCKTKNNLTAIKSGKWHCHESCWTKASLNSIKKARPIDVECAGGLHLYAVPIRADKKIIGSINFGYGDPPQDIKKLQKISKLYKIDLNKLKKEAAKYASRPTFLISIAKQRLKIAAKLIGEIVERKKTEKALDSAIANLTKRIKELNCLYSLSKVLENSNTSSIDNMLNQMPDIIRAAMLDPSLTCAKIVLNNKEFKTQNCAGTKCHKRITITTSGKNQGFIHIGYLHTKKKTPDKYLLKEEQAMLNLIANQIGKTLEHMEIKEKIQKAMNVKSDFIAVVSHELRTPLTAIKESIDIVLDEKLCKFGQEQQRFLNIAKRNVDRLARLINDVLDFQKIEAGKMKFRFQKQNINNIIKEVYNTSLIPVKQKDLSIILKLDKNLPKIKLCKDTITEVLLNIVNNSIRFTPKGTITISTLKNNRSRIQVSIKDTGPGIHKKDLPKLFHSFEQIDKGNKRKTGGTGLGLAIAKKIIEKHNGEIWAESSFGKGMAIHFTLPVNMHQK
ncbi:MAG: ATP-binding protein [Candidatus Omnitrophota bacterium]